MSEPAQTPGITYWCAIAVGVAASIWVLQQAQPVIIPIVLAFFCAVALQPIQTWFHRVLPSAIQPVSAFVTALFPVALFAGIIAGLWQVVEFFAPPMDHWSQLNDDLTASVTPLFERFGMDMPSLSDHAGSVIGGASSTAQSLLGTILGTLITLYLLLLMTSEQREFRERVLHHLGTKTRTSLDEALSAIGLKVRQFLLMRAVAGLISGLLATGWLLIMGVDYAPLWGALVFVLNFIPNLGSILAAGPPTFLTLVQAGPGEALAVAAGLFVIEQIVGNVIDPRLQGSRLRLSPFMVLFFVVFFTWLWGIPGTLTAVPCLVLLVVVLEQFPTTQPYAGLVRRTPRSRPLSDDA